MINDNTLLISIDLETLGQQVPRAAIATIGMAAFELANPAQPLSTCYTRIDRDSALQVGHADQATLDWWAKQPAEARAEIEGGDTPLRLALGRLAGTIDAITARRDPSEVIVVARAPSFDLAILAYHFEHFGTPLPWRYWQERDHRSLEDTYRDALALLGQDAPSYREMAPVAHHALKDAVAQAEYLLTLRRMLRESVCSALAEKPIDSAKPLQPVSVPLDAYELLHIWQTWLGADRESCDEGGKKLWDRIDAVFSSAKPPAVSIDQQQAGVYRKFDVCRTDGRDQPGGDRHGAEYFVLDLTHDEFAKVAAEAYARSCAAQYPLLALDMVRRYGLDDAPKLTPLNEHTRFILGRPNFLMAGVANVLRKRGDVIAHKAEDEQAAAIHFLLNHYEQHGKNWNTTAVAELRQIDTIQKQEGSEA